MEILAEIDEDGSGEIEFAEFCQVIHPYTFILPYITYSYPFTHIPIHLFIQPCNHFYPPIHPFVHSSLSSYSSFHSLNSILLFIHPSFQLYPPIHPFVHSSLSSYLSIHPFTHLYPPIYPSILSPLSSYSSFRSFISILLFIPPPIP